MGKSTFGWLRAMMLVLALWYLPAAARADAANLVQNGDFEQVNDGAARAWSFSSARPEIFELSFPQEKERGTVANMDVSSAVMSGYFNQTVSVKPNTSYHFSALTRLTQGEMLLYIHGGADESKLDTRIYVSVLGSHPLVPWFWKEEWIQGSSAFPNRNVGLVRNYLTNSNQWQPVSIDFTTGKLESITVSLGAYFETGQYQFDDVQITEVTSPQ